MTFALRGHAVRAIVLDIEGTTTPIAFVHDVLFPFARAHLRGHLAARAASQALQDTLRQLRRDRADEVARGEQPPDWTGSEWERVAAFVEWLMDRDRKAPGLKRLQGEIWERGFQERMLRGEVYPDVPPALRRWRDAGLGVAIYSSGSEQAQRLVLGTTPFGDLTGLVCRFFDTAVGPKVSSDSYRRIALELGCTTGEMLFVSDVTRELDAARGAGCQALLCVRPGNTPQAGGGYPVIRTFDEIPV
ncbi:MAG TPA: acireductone synthase [Vicinamibacterales bacterium]